MSESMLALFPLMCFDFAFFSLFSAGHIKAPFSENGDDRLLKIKNYNPNRILSGF
jgi:uncharacterized BrkB/YihY/UPF0761 family membrane protein